MRPFGSIVVCTMSAPRALNRLKASSYHRSRCSPIRRNDRPIERMSSRAARAPRGVKSFELLGSATEEYLLRPRLSPEMRVSSWARLGSIRCASRRHTPPGRSRASRGLHRASAAGLGYDARLSAGDCAKTDDVRRIHRAPVLAGGCARTVGAREPAPARVCAGGASAVDGHPARLLSPASSSETLDAIAGELRLLTDGRGLFLRTRQGHFFDLLADPTQPLVTGDGLPLEPVNGRARSRKSKASRSKK